MKKWSQNVKREKHHYKVTVAYDGLQMADYKK